MSRYVSARKAAENRLAEMTREQRIASLLMLHAPGTDESTLRAFVTEHQPGGIIFMPDNIGPSAADVAALSRAVRSDEHFPVLVAIDQEGGPVRRIRSDDFDSSVTLKHGEPDRTREAFGRRARLLDTAGVSINFGIVADVSPDATSFIYPRSLGETPSAADRVTAAVRGEAGVVLSTLKHFPGHGRTSGDSHTSIPETPVDLDTWLKTDAIPFAAGIAAGAELVMVGHLRYSAVETCPATLSRTWHRVLRERLGFDGVIITDDMLMLRDSGVSEYVDPSENAVRALAAGATMLLFVLSGNRATDGTSPGQLVADISRAIDVGRLTEQHISSAALQLLELRAGAVGTHGVSVRNTAAGGVHGLS
jgi:beta-N-acetylhexosaminidase